MAHRNYVNGEESPITVALYDDRLEVTSPGKLPNGVTVEKMREGCSECRNKALAQALAYMNIIEDWGSGIPRVCEEVKDAGLRELEITDWPDAVRTVIYRQSPPTDGGKVGGDEVKRRILCKIQENPRITITAIVSVLGGGKRTIERAVAELKTEGVIRRNGSARNGYWEVVK